MPKAEMILLISLCCYAVIAFLPIWREIELGGMAVFGWLMAFLMVAAPILALLVFRSSDRHSAASSDDSKIGEA
jgi:membrane protein CcdC involved in cytochrome C biogenesis